MKKVAIVIIACVLPSLLVAQAVFIMKKGDEGRCGEEEGCIFMTRSAFNSYTRAVRESALETCSKGKI